MLLQKLSTLECVDDKTFARQIQKQKCLGLFNQVLSTFTCLNKTRENDENLKLQK